MHKSIDYYLPLLKYCNDNKLPKDISRYIFNFLKTDIHKDLNNEFINFKIKTNLCYDNEFIIHIHDLPYKINIDTLKNNVSFFLKQNNCKKKFSHYCCNLKGVTFKEKNELDSMTIKNKNWYRII